LYSILRIIMMIIRANEKGENYDKRGEYNVAVAGDSLDDGV